MRRLLPSLARILLTLLLVLLAIVALDVVWRHYKDDPWTRDGAVGADVVQVAADVSGLVTAVQVRDNQAVRAGQVLFLVDQDRYAADLAQATAAVATSQANIENAAAGIASAQAALDNAVRDEKRYISLGNLVSPEERDQHITAAKQDRAALAQARATLAQAQAGLLQSKANQRLAEINLDRSSVRARVNGYITGFSMRPGDYVSTGSPLFALLDADSYYVVGYFEETKLRHVALGDKAQVLLLGETRPIWGHVDSLSAGITDREQNSSNVLLPNITPTFSWIRLAQRVPIRIVIDRIPNGVRAIAGRTATVTLYPGSAHRALGLTTGTPVPADNQPGYTALQPANPPAGNPTPSGAAPGSPAPGSPTPGSPPPGSPAPGNAP